MFSSLLVRTTADADALVLQPHSSFTAVAYELEAVSFKMVVVGSFKVELVEAATKIPFKEHSKDGSTYVEAEPDAEYFMSVLKMSKTETDVHCACSVDGGAVTGLAGYPKDHISTEPLYFGIRSDRDGESHSTQTALKFVKPQITHGSTNANSNSLLMGKVEVLLRELTYTGRMLPCSTSSVTSSFTAASVDMNNQAAAGKKKNLRSDKGNMTVSSLPKSTAHREKIVGSLLDMSKCDIICALKPHSASPEHHRILTALESLILYFLPLTVTLNYCAALGLMHVGVLKKPSEWEYHRMMHPAVPGSNLAAVKGAAVTGNTVDISELDSDDE